jgi:excisionase family DNA binding protein
MSQVSQVCYASPMDLKSKREAAQMLGLSTRGIERAVRRGHLTVLYRDSKHGKQAWFKAPELERLMQMQQRHGPVGFTSGIPPRPEVPAAPAIGTLVPMVEIPPRRHGRERERVGVAITDRLTLTIDDAVQLSGLPHSFITENIRSGKLKSIAIGRRHFIKRADLNEFVDKL